MKQFDIALVIGSVRQTTYYLNILKYLGKNYSIALVKVPLKVPLNETHPGSDGKTLQDKFLEKCIELGGIPAEKEPVKSKVAIYPQMVYLEETVEFLKNNIQTDKKIAVMGLTGAGRTDEFIFEMDIHVIWVVHRRFFDFLLKERNLESRYIGKQILECGFPYKKYPIFSNVNADYLFAAPNCSSNTFSFPNEKDKWPFLETVLSLFSKMSAKETVLYKEHNSSKYDRLQPTGRKQKMFFFTMKLLPFRIRISLLKMLSKCKGVIGEKAGECATFHLFEKIRKRSIALNCYTEEHYMAMEAFLPGISKGIIGGLSDTIWGAMFFELPYYNCANLYSGERDKESIRYKPHVGSLLETNVKFYEVPFCKGELKFDTSYFRIVDESCKNADFIELLKSEIAGEEKIGRFSQIDKI